MKLDFKYLFIKTWFLIVLAGFLGYIVYVWTIDNFNVLASVIVVSAMWSASLMYAGLVVGFRLGSDKKIK